MSRNANSRFALNPTNVDISRSTFDRNHSVKMSFNAGDIVPHYLDEVLPGDTFQIHTSKVIRTSSPFVVPVMDNIYIDTYYFFVPSRILWEHWKQFNGENTESAWIPETEYSIPQVTAPPAIPADGDNPGHPGGWDVGTIADYFGIPTGVPGLSVNALPFRAYALICNEWFRDQNNQDPLDIPFGDSTVTGVNTGNYVTDVSKGGKPYIAAKYHDYFTSALPSPQKGPDVGIGLSGNANVWGNGKTLGLTDGTAFRGIGVGNNATAGMSFVSPIDSNLNGIVTAPATPAANAAWGVVRKTDGHDSGLIADLSTASSVTVNALRLAFATQKMFEKDARGGTRYVEMIKSHFGVTSPDARQQRPEYLGGNRIPINVNQVVQQSGEVGDTPLANVAGYSLTTDSHGDFIKSFTEHGYVIGLSCVRYDHTYQQGLDRMWSRKNRMDFYLPVFANLGEQPVRNKEIYCTGTTQDDEVFGYQEAWAEYRFKPSRVAGEMRSQYSASLDVWHLADDYESLPVLQSDWIFEDKTNLDRCLQVSSTVSNQFISDMYIKVRATRPMPMYSIPGLIDHH